MKRLAVTTEEMWRLYQTGLSAAEVAAELEVSVPTVKQRFKREGLAMRPATERTDRWYSNIAKAKTTNGTWSKSAVEDRFARTLDELGVRYVRSLNVGRYSIDFALVEYKIAIECDGAQHWSRWRHDQVRDAALSAQGWQVHRIKVKNGKMTGRVLLRRLLQKLGLLEVAKVDVEREQQRRLHAARRR